MPAYLMFAVKVISPAGWAQYQTDVMRCIQAHGGRLLVKKARVEAFDGVFRHDRLTMFRFVSMEAIRAFWASETYNNDIRPLTEGLGIVETWAVPGAEDVSEIYREVRNECEDA